MQVYAHLARYTVERDVRALGAQHALRGVAQRLPAVGRVTKPLADRVDDVLDVLYERKPAAAGRHK